MDAALSLDSFAGAVGASAQPLRSRLPSRPMVGFLYNHDATHQVAHSASIISAMLARYPQIDITILVTSDALWSAVRSVCGPDIEARCRIIRLDVPEWHRPILSALDFLAPASRVDHLRHNASLFGIFDAIVVTERTSLLLKQLACCERTKLLYVSHGSGDRSIGFKADIGQFDLVMLSGDKLRQRFLDAGAVPDSRIKVVGYPKFDAVARGRRAFKPLFPEDRPIVLYNPHHEPKLSSWYDMGRDVLDFFLSSKDYNLIFAPHVMLFRRRVHVSLEWFAVRFRAALPAKYLNVPHIHVDTGGAACTDMTYTAAADIYLGDASSQVYEFLSRPRPCIHLNAHKANWQGDPNYLFWTLGPVVDDVAELPHVLRTAFQTHWRYAPVQKRILESTFAASEVSPSERAAHAVAEALGLERSAAVT